MSAAYVAELTRLLGEIDSEHIVGVGRVLREAHAVFVAGNGGSAANASHLSLHLGEAGLNAVDLTAEVPLLTALANDHGYASVLLKRLRAMAKPADALVIISGSGDSPNILAALAEAKRIGMARIGLLGFGGGAARTLCDCAVVIGSHDYGPVEDVHSALVHMLAQAIRL